MPEFTVAIRTYNRENYLPALLERLRSQRDTENINWDIIIVDNNSTDNTAKIIQDYQCNWAEAFPLKYFFESQPGAYYARQRAIQEAQSPLIGFLDDDNLPALDWVAKAYLFAQSHPQAGAYGSQIHGTFEVPPPENFERIAGFLPIVERQQTICFNTYRAKGVLPPGAGLVIRQQAWLDCIPKYLILQGPVGQSLAAKGEDIEALIYIQKAGWEIWYNSEMHIDHYIPKTRLEKQYLQQFFQGIGRGRHHTRMLRYKRWQRPFMFFLYLINDFRRLAIHWLKYRRVMTTDIVAASEMSLLVNSLASPFYFRRR
ncbi:MAG: hormogonium polysaccharide biosynthesis glycosyltransferase HpsE [Coleofasciculus sp. G1-WW12-02]|uniref:hormogonium polysaccharide biosynthesis glycosyltransferase HpsE n=1 Tax=Coleofasciculus sp. G1-WW12-02 TaxID=3068483 RepID=UPI0032F60159